VEVQSLMQTNANSCEVFAFLNLPPSVHKIVSRYLSVMQVLLSFAAESNFHCVLLIYEREC